MTKETFKTIMDNIEQLLSGTSSDWEDFVDEHENVTFEDIEKCVGNIIARTKFPDCEMCSHIGNRLYNSIYDTPCITCVRYRKTQDNFVADKNIKENIEMYKRGA